MQSTKRKAIADSSIAVDTEIQKRAKTAMLHNSNSNSMDLKGKGVAVSASSFDPRKYDSTGGPQPAKKLVIKSLKVRPKLPDNFEADTWATLKTAVAAIHQKKPVHYGLEELYKACENLCQHKMAEALYQKLQRECEAHVQGELVTLKENANSAQKNFLECLNELWSHYCEQTMMIRGIFLYLDRTYILQQQELSSIWDMGLGLFRGQIMNDPSIRKRTIDGMLGEIERERNGDHVDRDVLRSLVRMLLDLGIYYSAFEHVFLEHTQLYYRTEGDMKIAEMDSQGSGARAVALYLKHVEERLRQESDRSALTTGYIDAGTRSRLVKELEGELTKRHIDVLLERGFDGLMSDKMNDDLRRLYGMLSRVDGLDKMKKSFAAYIRKNGLAVVSDKERDATMVPALIQLKGDLDGVLQIAFNKNEMFANSLKESFEYFINQRHNKPAEMIAKYIDSLLKSGKGVTEEETESTLDKCLVLFRYIQGKDVFEAFYKNDLAKRLLLNRSASVDSEKSMLSKLKTECGSGFTSKLEGMFKDMDVSKDIMTSFRETRYADQLSGIEMYVNVLSAAYWPTYTPVELTLPPYLSTCLEVFKQFYTSKHSGRRLTWQHSLGHCNLKAHFPKGHKELSVSMYQATVLLLFNTNERLTYAEIKEQLKIENRELTRTLQSLACGKVRVLTKTPKGRDVDPDKDSFSINDAFENPLFRIKINAIQAKETVEEQKATTEKVFHDRHHQVDAAIVRIMKMRKTLSHRMLTAEVLDQLKFPIKNEDFKKRVESLVDREYLERDKNDQSLYHYMA